MTIADAWNTAHVQLYW